MLVDANLLIYAVDAASPFHDRSREWLTAQLNSSSRVAIPWQSFAAFLRIVTHPRASKDPLSPGEAWSFVEDWLAVDAVWTPEPGNGYAKLVSELILRHNVSGNLVPDVMLAALAIEHGLPVCSADSDFARFSELTWVNPLA